MKNTEPNCVIAAPKVFRRLVVEFLVCFAVEIFGDQGLDNLTPFRSKSVLENLSSPTL